MNASFQSLIALNGVLFAMLPVPPTHPGGCYVLLSALFEIECHLFFIETTATDMSGRLLLLTITGRLDLFYFKMVFSTGVIPILTGDKHCLSAPASGQALSFSYSSIFIFFSSDCRFRTYYIANVSSI